MSPNFGILITFRGKLLFEIMSFCQKGVLVSQNFSFSEKRTKAFFKKMVICNNTLTYIDQYNSFTMVKNVSPFSIP